MKRVIIALLVMVGFTGCNTTAVNGPMYRGDAAIEGPVRAVYAQQLEIVGGDPEEAQTFKFIGHRLDPQGRNRYGYFGDLQGNSIHGATDSQRYADWVNFWFAFPAGGSPDDWTVRHEVGHHTIAQMIGVGGHPMNVTINGRTWQINEIIGAGIRWPMFVNLRNGFRHPIAFWDNSGYLCLGSNFKREGAYWGREEQE